MTLRRCICILLMVLSLRLTTCLTAQSPVAAGPVVADLNAALVGQWVGVLEYRDYKESASSTKRVVLPTWLSVEAAGPAQAWTYTYDDGPGKVVVERDVTRFDPAARTYSSATDGKAGASFAVTGCEGLKAGRGVLVLLGSGTDDGKPSEMRVTMTVKRNVLEMLQEVRPAGSANAFVFRHAYRFVRSAVPAVAAAK